MIGSPNGNDFSITLGPLGNLAEVTEKGISVIPVFYTKHSVGVPYSLIRSSPALKASLALPPGILLCRHRVFSRPGMPIHTETSSHEESPLPVLILQLLQNKSNCEATDHKEKGHSPKTHHGPAEALRKARTLQSQPWRETRRRATTQEHSLRPVVSLPRTQALGGQTLQRKTHIRKAAFNQQGSNQQWRRHMEGSLLICNNRTNCCFQGKEMLSHQAWKPGFLPHPLCQSHTPRGIQHMYFLMRLK